MVGDFFCLQPFGRRASLPGALLKRGLQLFSLSASAAKGYARLQLDVAVDSQTRVAEDFLRHPSLLYAQFVFLAGQLMGSGLDPEGSAV